MSERNLTELLSDLYDFDELARLLQSVFGKEGHQLVQSVPKDLGDRDRLGHVVLGMKRRGLLEDAAFYDALVEDRPRRAVEIRRTAEPLQRQQPALETTTSAPQAQSPSEAAPQRRREVSQMLAQELFELDWATFGRELLTSAAGHPDGSSVYVAWLDRTSAALYHGPRTSQDEAIRLLRDWLDQFPDNPRSPGFRLRLVMYLKHQSYDRDRVRARAALRRALEAIDPLIDQYPDFAVLHCLRGNFCTGLEDYAGTLKACEVARNLSPGWLEPAMEEVEACILLQPEPDYGRATDVAAGALTETRHPRERLVLLSYQIAAMVLVDPSSPYAQQDYKRDIYELEKTLVPDEQRENWRTEKVAEHIQKLRGKVIGEAVADDLIKMLVFVQEAVRKR